MQGETWDVGDVLWQLRVEVDIVGDFATHRHAIIRDGTDN